MVVIAAASDLADGGAARLLRVQSTAGSVVDALTDKFFAWSALIALAVEGQLAWWQLALLAPRDVVVLVGAGAYVLRQQSWTLCARHALLGKGATAALLIFLFAELSFPEGYPVAMFVYGLAVVAGLAAAVVYLRQWVGESSPGGV